MNIEGIEYMHIVCPNGFDCANYRGLFPECKSCEWNQELEYTVTQTTIAQKCPICEGRGNVYHGFYEHSNPVYGTGGLLTEVCRNCAGTGILYVKQ